MEERAKMSAATFALVLSLPVLFALLRFPSSPPEGWDGEEDEAGRMADSRGAALLLVIGRWRCGGDVVAIASPRSGRCGRLALSLSADTSGRSGERLAMVGR